MAIALIAAGAGLDMSKRLVILVLAPVATIVGCEMWGYRRQADALAD